jgi:hypothetical protein
MSTKTLAIEEQRSRLERRANVIRSRLLRTIDALDTRRHQVTEIGHRAKRLAVPVIATVIGVAVLAAGATFAIRAQFELRRERRFGYRLAKSLAPLRRKERPPFWQEALRKVTLATLGVIASALVKRGAKAMSEGRPSRIPPAQLPAAGMSAPPLVGG